MLRIIKIVRVVLNPAVGVVLLFAGSPATAVVMEMAQGKPLAVAATTVAAAEGVRLLNQGGNVAVAAASGDAWTWNYAFAVKLFPPSTHTQVADTTPNDLDGRADPNVAYALAQKNGSFGRFAVAEGRAQVRDYLDPIYDNAGNIRQGPVLEKGDMQVFTNTNRFAVAKSFAGIGKQYVSGGANTVAFIATKLLQVGLDPPPPAGLLPDPADLHAKLPDEGGPSGFYFGVGYVDPYGQDHTLLTLTGELGYDVALQEYNVALAVTAPAGTTGLPDPSLFTPTILADGSVFMNYLASESDLIKIPFTVPTEWGDSAVFTVYNELGVVSRSVPEPATMPLFASALLALGLSRHRRGRCKAFRAPGENGGDQCGSVRPVPDCAGN
jgi:hypothetical protein